MCLVNRPFLYYNWIVFDLGREIGKGLKKAMFPFF